MDRMAGERFASRYGKKKEGRLTKKRVKKGEGEHDILLNRSVLRGGHREPKIWEGAHH